MASAKSPVLKNGREPDWGRFGLDDERKPLNPSAAENGGESGTLTQENKELYGGQAQNKNELFAQDQVVLIDYTKIYFGKQNGNWKTYCF